MEGTPPYRRQAWIRANPIIFFLGGEESGGGEVGIVSVATTVYTHTHISAVIGYPAWTPLEEVTSLLQTL